MNEYFKKTYIVRYKKLLVKHNILISFKILWLLACVPFVAFSQYVLSLWGCCSLFIILLRINAVIFIHSSMCQTRLLCKHHTFPQTNLTFLLKTLLNSALVCVNYCHLACERLCLKWGVDRALCSRRHVIDRIPGASHTHMRRY